MSELLVELGALEETQDERTTKITVGEVVDKAAEAGFAFVIAVLALLAIPFFPLGTPFGLAMAVLGVQMMVGKQHPWLPRRARRRELNLSMLDRIATMLSRRTRWLLKLTRRRHEAIVAPKVIGACITILALGLALPLPIPGANLVFLIPILIYAIGLLERDGRWIMVGHACLVIDLGLVVVFAATIVAVVEKLWAWIS